MLVRKSGFVILKVASLRADIDQINKRKFIIQFINFFIVVLNLSLVGPILTKSFPVTHK